MKGRGRRPAIWRGILYLFLALGLVGPGYIIYRLRQWMFIQPHAEAWVSIRFDHPEVLDLAAAKADVDLYPSREIKLGFGRRNMGAPGSLDCAQAAEPQGTVVTPSLSDGGLRAVFEDPEYSFGALQTRVVELKIPFRRAPGRITVKLDAWSSKECLPTEIPLKTRSYATHLYSSHHRLCKDTSSSFRIEVPTEFVLTLDPQGSAGLKQSPDDGAFAWLPADHRILPYRVDEAYPGGSAVREVQASPSTWLVPRELFGIFRRQYKEWPALDSLEFRAAQHEPTGTCGASWKVADDPNKHVLRIDRVARSTEACVLLLWVEDPRPELSWSGPTMTAVELDPKEPAPPTP